MEGIRHHKGSPPYKGDKFLRRNISEGFFQIRVVFFNRNQFNVKAIRFCKGKDLFPMF